MSDGDHASTPARTVGGFDRAARWWVLGLFALGGAGLGALLPLLARLAGELPWMPFQGPLRLLGSFEQPWLVWGLPLAGLVLGLGLAAWTILDSPVLEVAADSVKVLRRGEVQRALERSKVDAVYRRGSRTVIESGAGRTLFEGDVEGDQSQVRAAFIDLGYPWEGSRD